MLTLGLAGGLDPVYETRLDTPENYTYDGAAVLVEDGRVVAAIEEERLNRIKRSNKFPVQAIQFCLEQRGINASDIDLIAYYVHETAANGLLSRLYLANSDIERRIDARTLMSELLGRKLHCRIDPGRLRFFQHKLTHAASVMAQSGFDESLIFVNDNVGGLFLGHRDNKGKVCLEPIVELPASKSLWRFCQGVLLFLGLGLFEEYKALALAPYGDVATYNPLYKRLYELLPNGDYTLHRDQIDLLIGQVDPRQRHQPFSQTHKDLAASLQHAMQEIVLHVLGHYRHKTGQRNLCMAGGMAENSSINSYILYSALFDQVFVHPAAYDSGCALGAALLASCEGDIAKNVRVQDVYWGTGIGTEHEMMAELERWHGFLNFESFPNVGRRTAELIAQGAVVGWVQGRSEFGSHALGNRNVLADPRFEENRSRVNKILGRQEDYRPLASSVLEEHAQELCELPAGTATFPFMTFAVRVHEDKRSLLRATTHMDGMTRLQTVSQDTNSRFWGLIEAFKELTGAPALLSASFNNSVEPVVDTVQDAVVSFLTTDLDYLVVGNFVAKKCTPTWEDWLSLRLSLPPQVQLIRMKGHMERQQMASRNELRTSYDPQRRRGISKELGDLLINLDGETWVGELLRQGASEAQRKQALLSELIQLWSERFVTMYP
jgi:carbamoyltransferase